MFDSEELEVIRRGRNINTGLVPPLVRDLVSVPLLSAGDSSRDGAERIMWLFGKHGVRVERCLYSDIGLYLTEVFCIRNYEFCKLEL